MVPFESSVFGHGTIYKLKKHVSRENQFVVQFRPTIISE